MESSEGGVLRRLEDGPAGGLGRFDHSDDFVLGLNDLGQRERRWTSRRGQVPTDVRFERVGPEETQE
jgi:hypothetical protein